MRLVKDVTSGPLRSAPAEAGLVERLDDSLVAQRAAQAITAQTAITRMSISRWSILPWQRGSSTTPRCRTRLSMDMILSSPARGHVIIHQARASDKNFMRLPCARRFFRHRGRGTLQAFLDAHFCPENM